MLSHNGLTSVTIPDSVTAIGAFAFSNNALASLTIREQRDEPLGMLLSLDNALTSLTIPDSVTTIGDMLSLITTSPA